MRERRPWDSGRWFRMENHPAAWFPNVHSSARVDESVRVFGDPAELHVSAGSRIDAMTVITVGPKGVWIGRNTHVGVGCRLLGAHGLIEVGHCCSLSPGASVFTATDHPGTDQLVGPCVPPEHRRVQTGGVVIEDGAAVFTNAVLLPGVIVGTGAVVGAGMTVLRGVVPAGAILKTGGTDAMLRRDVERIKERIREVLDAEGR